MHSLALNKGVCPPFDEGLMYVSFLHWDPIVDLSTYTLFKLVLFSKQLKKAAIQTAIQMHQHSQRLVLLCISDAFRTPLASVRMSLCGTLLITEFKYSLGTSIKW